MCISHVLMTPLFIMHQIVYSLCNGDIITLVYEVLYLFTACTIMESFQQSYEICQYVQLFSHASFLVIL